jgi:hypothetical protein
VGLLRANLTEHVARARHLKETVFVVDRTKGRKRVAALVPIEFYQRAIDDRARLESLEK